MRRTAGKSAWQDEILAWPEQDREWARSFAQAMLLAGADESGTVVGLKDSLAAVQASGERPGELFGSAGAYGRSCGRRLIPAPDRLERDLTFSSMPLLVSAMLISVGLSIALLGVFIGVTDGWAAQTFAGKPLILFPLVGLLLTIACWGWTIHSRGQLRQAAGLWIGTGAAVVSLPWLMLVLPEMPALALPAWTVVIAGAALMGIASLLPKIRSRKLAQDTNWDAERWLAHAQALLRGRYHFSKEQARVAVREARAHLELGGETVGTPAQEFGNVEVFVAGLAAAGDKAVRRTVLLKTSALFLAAAVLYALSVIGIVLDGNWSLGAYGALVGTWCLVQGLTKRSGREALRVQRRRRFDAAAMEDGLHD